MRPAKKICVITGTRADYGLLKNIIKLLNDSDKFELQLIITGTHLSNKYGETLKEIESDGFNINHKIDLNLKSDTPKAITKSTSIGLDGFGNALSILKPDMNLVLGDRYEILSAVIASMFARIPIAHLHGGELTMGAIDDSIRHSITKFSHLHFVATEEYRNRVIQLGENPKTVFNVGGLGVDAIKKIKLIKKNDLEKLLGFSFLEKNLLITFHPVTLDDNSSSNQLIELLDALSKFKDTLLIFTAPNSDTDNLVIFDLIENFVSKNSNAFSFKSLGQLRYFSCLAHVDAVVGNSSSGLTEVPTFKKATINIGDRQKGRIQATSIVNCKPVSANIQKAIKKSYTDEFKKILSNTINPYGNGGSSESIINTLDSTDFNSLIKKRFYDLDMK